MRKTGVSKPYSRPLSIFGAEGMIANLHASGKRVNKAVIKRNHRTAAAMRDRAKLYVPIDRGYLHDSIEYFLSPAGLTFTVWCNPATFAAIATGPEEPYDIWVEFGTSVAPAQPFMTPAFNELYPEYHTGMRDDVRKAIRADDRA